MTSLDLLPKSVKQANKEWNEAWKSRDKISKIGPLCIHTIANI